VNEKLKMCRKQNKTQEHVKEVAWMRMRIPRQVRIALLMKVTETWKIRTETA
jgi:hypothetical protein